MVGLQVMQNGWRLYLGCLLGLFTVVHARAAVAQQPKPARSPACTEKFAVLDQPVQESDYVRLAQLTGFARLKSLAFERVGESVIEVPCERTLPGVLRAAVRGGVAAGRNGIELAPVYVLSTFNSAYPRDRDNGSLWSGRGLSAVGGAGIKFRYGWISGAVAPSFVFQQNRAFDIVTVDKPDFSPYTNPHYRIDLPQRFGDSQFSSIDPGATYLRLAAPFAAIGVSSENVRWGPAVRNPLLLSYNAAGFPHVYLETVKPVPLGIGRLDAQVITGRLTESDYFNFTKNKRLLQGFVLAFEPRGLTGLYLSAAMIYEWVVSDATPLTLSSFLAGLAPIALPSNFTNKTGNTMAAFSARWALPGAGFEVYAELGRDDYTENLLDLLKEPDHSQVYTLGFQKVVPGASRWVRVSGELTHLEGALPFRSGRGVVEFYTHDVDAAGHTNLGQSLGAALPPGSDSQFLGLDVFAARGSLGFYVERTRYNDDAYYATFARYYGVHGHDAEITGGLRGSVVTRPLNIRAELSYSRRFDRDFIGEEDFDSIFRVDNNLGIRLTASFLAPERRRRAAAPSDASMN